VEPNQLPRQDLQDAETGCCPRFDPGPWDGQEFHFRDQPFVKGTTRSFLHVPLNMSRVMATTMAAIRAAGADSPDQFALLSYEPSPWRAEHYFWVTREVPGLENVRLSGDFLAKVFEGPFKEAGKWAAETGSFVRSQGRDLKRLYMYYTACPKCAKHYGKNYVVAFAQVD
jgi:hypothetical protein